MTERLPYEEQLAIQWNDLPLPDENMAWENMKRRLEEEDDSTILPFWLRGCAGWGLLGLLLLGLSWWMIRPEKWFNKKQDKEKETTVSEEKKKEDKGPPNGSTIQFKTGEPGIINQDSLQRVSKRNSADSLQVIDETVKIKAVNSINTAVMPVRSATVRRKDPRINKTKEPVVKTVKEKEQTREKKEKELTDSSLTIAKTDPLAKESMNIISESKKELTDTVTKASIDSFKKENTDTVARSIAKKDTVKKKIISFSAGIALQQQLPIAGQGFTPYNSLGRKGTLADYIPSIYFRMIRPGKWFLQTEFRYGAPQYTKKITYRQTIVPDTGSNPQYSTKTDANLKKIYYHQLPITFNYFVARNWSVGAGVQWNKLYATITEEEISKLNNFTQQDSLVSKNIFSSRPDTASSFFKRSYWQGVFESQYKWKRFSFGARYTFGLQPYLQFRLTSGEKKEERNHSLQFFIRYELWKSKNSR